MISREVSNPKEELVQVERKITKTLDTLFTLCSEVEFKDEIMHQYLQEYMDMNLISIQGGLTVVMPLLGWRVHRKTTKGYIWR